MSKSTVAFEWQELQEPQEFAPHASISHAPPSPTPKRQQPRWIVLIGALCLLVLALVGAVWVERQAQAGLAEIQHELALAVDAEVWQAERARPSVAASIGGGALGDRAALAEYQSARAWPTPNHTAEIVPTDLSQGIAIDREKVKSVEVAALQRDLAAVTVISEAAPEDIHPGQRAAITYRQVRFYRRTEQGWLPAPPQPTLWGQSQRLATQHFDFTYRSRDAQAVETVAADLDALYIEIRGNLGLSPTPPHKIAIEIVMGDVAASPIMPTQRATHLMVSSPVLARAPASLTDAAILRQSILAVLVDKVIEEAAYAHHIPPRWYPLLSAMRQWQIWDLGGPPAEWREPLFRWLYGDPKWMDDHASSHRPAQFRNVIQLPAYQYLLTPPYDPWGGQGDQIYAQGRFESVLTAALLDYIAATYGREQIGALWPHLRVHQDWKTLISAAFDMTVAEFEAGWRAYLAEISGDPKQVFGD